MRSAVSSSAYCGRKNEYHSKSYRAQHLQQLLEAQQRHVEGVVGEDERAHGAERLQLLQLRARQASTGISVSGPWFTGYSQNAQVNAQLRAVRVWTVW